MIDFKDIDDFLKNASVDEINELSQLVIDNSSNDSIDESFKFAQDICDEFLSNGFVLDDNDIDTIAELSILLNKTADFKERTYIDTLDNFYKDPEKYKTYNDRLQAVKDSIIEKYKNIDAFKEKKELIDKDLQLVTQSTEALLNNKSDLKQFLNIASEYASDFPDIGYTTEISKEDKTLKFYQSIFEDVITDINDNLADVSNLLRSIENKVHYKEYGVINLVDSTKSIAASFVISGLFKPENKGDDGKWDFSNFTISEAWGDSKLINAFISYLDETQKKEDIIPYIQDDKDTYRYYETGEQYTVEILDPTEKNKIFNATNPFSDGDGSTSYYSTSPKFDSKGDIDEETSFARSDLLKPKKVRYKTKLLSSQAYNEIETTDEKLKKKLPRLETTKKELRNYKRELLKPFQKIHGLSGSKSSNKSYTEIKKYINEGNIDKDKLLELYKDALSSAGVGSDFKSLDDISREKDERKNIDSPVIQTILSGYEGYEQISPENIEGTGTVGGDPESIETIQEILSDKLNIVSTYLESKIEKAPDIIKGFQSNFSIVSEGYNHFEKEYKDNKKKYEQYRKDFDGDVKLKQKRQRKFDTEDTQNALLYVANTTNEYLEKFQSDLKKAINHLKDLSETIKSPQLDIDKKFLVKTIGDMHDPSFDDFEFNVTVSDLIDDVDYRGVHERKDTHSKTTYFAILSGWYSAVQKTKSVLKNDIKEYDYSGRKRQLDEQGLQTLHDLQGGHPSQEHEDLIQESRKNTGILNDLATKRKELENLLTDDLDDDTKEEINNQIVELDALQEQYSNRNKEISSKLQDMLPKQESPFTGQSYDAYKSEKEKGLYAPKNK